MSYFLKQTPGKNRTYLSIVDSHYSSTKKDTAHSIYKSLRSIEYWKSQGIEDPVAHFQKEVDKLNKEREKDKITEITELSPQRYLGYFPAKAILDKLDIKKYVNFFNLTTDFSFNLYDVLSGLIYCRLVKPCSKYKTYYEVLPYLFEKFDYSYNQLLAGLAYIGNDYEKFVELFTMQYKSIYGINTSKTYFDCTNFYFEIDKEDDLRRKGPSKENRKEPIVGLGLLLDANIIPIGMKLYPGNESEKPIINEVINEMKTQNNITGKTIRVADKGLNSAKNIYIAKINHDGYIFSKSVKTLPEVEKVWVLLDKDYHDVKDKNGELLYRYKECIDTFSYEFINDEGKKASFNVKEKRVVTYNPTLAKKKLYEIDRMIDKATNLVLSKAKRDEYGESSRYVDFKGKDGNKAIASLNQNKIETDKKLAGYNLIVTSELDMKASDIYSIYHNLWHIEESFKIMKSDLDARPAFMKTEETIKGHFTICYLAAFVERIFEFIILKEEYPHEPIFDFFHKLKVVKTENKYLNITASTDLIRYIREKFALPITNYMLKESDIKKTLNWKI